MSDRRLTEKLFLGGTLKVLCTADDFLSFDLRSKLFPVLGVTTTLAGKDKVSWLM